MLQEVKKERARPHKSDDKRASRRRSGANLSAKDIENALKGLSKSSESDDVASSIETLRPLSEVVDEIEYNRLLKTLDRDYSNRQLLDYLTRTGDPMIPNRELPEPTPAAKRKQELILSGWRAGKTDLSQRVVIGKETRCSEKLSAAERVLRNAWNLLIRAEEQAIGELEVQLLPWQQNLLFGTEIKDRPEFDAFVQSPLLTSAAEFQLYKPDNTLRITARRRDAEEIARRIASHLNQAQRLDIDLKAYVPLLGRDGRPDQLDELLDPEHLAYVARLTHCVVAIVEESVVAIYGTKSSGREDARRLLLSFLDLPPPASFRELYSPSLPLPQPKVALDGHAPDETVPLPLDILKSGLHRRYHHLDLVRAVKPRVKRTQDPAAHFENGTGTSSGSTAASAHDQMLAATSADVANRLATVPTMTDILDPNQHESSYWVGGTQALQSTNWTAHLCDILYSRHQWRGRSSRSESSSDIDKPVTHITRHHAPRVRNLLSLLMPEDGSASGQWIIEAQFVPCPSTRTDAGERALDLPRIKARFEYSECTEASGQPELKLASLCAIMNEQILDVALPQFATDVSFIRTALCIADLDRARRDHDIRNFAHRLSQSMQEGSKVLSPPSSLTFQMPRRIGVFTPSSSEHVGNDGRISYLLEKLQHAQQIEFMPSINTHADPDGLKALGPRGLDNMPPSMRLNYREVDGGATLGSFATLHLSHDATKNDVLEMGEGSVDSSLLDQAPPSAANELTGAAVRMADILTRLDVATVG